MFTIYPRESGWSNQLLMICCCAKNLEQTFEPIHTKDFQRVFSSLYLSIPPTPFPIDHGKTKSKWVNWFEVVGVTCILFVALRSRTEATQIKQHKSRDMEDSLTGSIVKALKALRSPGSQCHLGCLQSHIRACSHGVDVGYMHFGTSNSKETVPRGNKNSIKLFCGVSSGADQNLSP